MKILAGPLSYVRPTELLQADKKCLPGIEDLRNNSTVSGRSMKDDRSVVYAKVFPIAFLGIHRRILEQIDIEPLLAPGIGIVASLLLRAKNISG